MIRVLWQYLFMILIIAIMALLLGCARRAPVNLLNGAHTSAMTVTMSTCVDSTGVKSPVVLVSMPHTALIFKKQGQQIEAGLEVSVSAFAGEDLVGGGVATKKITIGNWGAAHTDSLITMQVPLQINTEERAVLKVRARSLNSSRYWNSQLTYNPRMYGNIPLNIVDFSWNVGPQQTLSQHNDEFKVELTVLEAPQAADRLAAESQAQWWVVLDITSKNE